MASFTKFNQYIEYVFEAVINHQSDTLKLMLTNTAPSASNSLKADITEITTTSGTGYTAGGENVTVSSSAQTSGTYKLVLADVTWTATGTGIGPFRYAVLYDNTPSSPLKPLIAYWDYGSSITLAAGESFTADFDPSTGALTAA